MTQPKKPKGEKPFTATELPELQAWLSNEYHVERLKQLVEDPIFLAAAHYATELLRVQHRDITGPWALLDAELMRKSCVHAGCAEFVRMFKNLSKGLNTPVEQEVEPWGHITK